LSNHGVFTIAPPKCPGDQWEDNFRRLEEYVAANGNASFLETMRKMVILLAAGSPLNGTSELRAPWKRIVNVS